MEQSLFEAADAKQQSIGLLLYYSYRYWHKLRLLFNIIVGIAGLAATLLFGGFHLSLFDLFGVLTWGLVANGLYSAGYALESVVIVKSEGRHTLKSARTLLFCIGTFTYAVLSFVYAAYYFLPIPD